MGCRYVTALVVEDSDDAREAMCGVLQQAGFEAEGARSAEEALEKLRCGLRPRVILLDLVLEHMSGYEFRSAQLAEAEDIARIPVIVVSGVYEPRSQAGVLGAAGYLHKPVNPAEVLSVVASASLVSKTKRQA